MRRGLPLEHVRRLSGFGRSAYFDGYVFEVQSQEDLARLFDLARENGRQVVLRGSGLSYGDAATGAECIVARMSGMNRILGWDPQSGIIEVEGGVTLAAIWQKSLPEGWWLPVVSGTMFPTVGGALAMNIHGKNSYRMGTLGEHVLELEVFPPGTSMPLTLRPSDELFRAIISGAGLLAPITKATLQLKEVPGGDVEVEPVPCAGWGDQLSAFEDHVADDYMVSWIDCFARGGRAGRGIFHSARHVGGPAETLTRGHQSLPDKIARIVPKSQVWRVLRALNNRPAMRSVNFAKCLAAKWERPGRQSLAAYNFLLDYVPGWELAYGEGGFIQYQSFIPAARAADVFRTQVEMQQAEGLESYLAVLKRHRPDSFLFSHGVEGFSLALDFKLTHGNRRLLWKLCHAMNDLVLSAGGRFYFAKDSTMRSEDAQKYLGAETLERFRRYKLALDPEGILTSELARRLMLV